MLKAYKYRLLPTDDQKIVLILHFNACRFVYNLALETKIRAWESAKKVLSAYELMKQLTELKNTEGKWLKECNAQSLESSIKNMDSAFKSFFNKHTAYPKFKNRYARQSVHFRQETKVKDNKVFLSKIGWFDFIKHRELPEGIIRCATVSKTPADTYFISILIKTTDDLPEKKLIEEDTAIGVDMGLKVFATLSDGQVFENPKYYQSQIIRLRKEQRTLTRRFKKGVKEQSKKILPTKNGCS